MTPYTTRKKYGFQVKDVASMEIGDALDIEVIINRNDSLKYNSVVLNGKKYKV